MTLVLLGPAAALGAEGTSATARFRAPSSGSAAKVVIYLQSSHARSLVAAIHRNVRGRPGALLSSGVLASPDGGAWNTVKLTARALTAGEYWLTVAARHGTIAWPLDRRGRCSGRAAVLVRLNTVPSRASLARAHSAPCGAVAYLVLSTPRSSPLQSGFPVSPTTSIATVASAPEEPAPEVPQTAPVNTVPPKITGTTVEGHSLEASTGTWTEQPTSFSYRWRRCNSSGGSCMSITGATALGYTLKGADVGHTLRVEVTAGNTLGATPATSAQTAVVQTAPPGVPVNTAVPLISGTLVEGNTLKSTNGSWSNSPTSFAYQWQDCNSGGTGCATISGATASSYKLKAGDIGHRVRSLVTAANGTGSSTPAPSTATAVVSEPPPEEEHQSEGELFVAPSGKDSAACSEAAPCLTMGHAFEKASAGQTVRMLSGSYPAQTIQGAEKGAAHVVFAPAAGASVKVTGTILVIGSHVTVSGIGVQDVTIGNYDQTPGRPNPSDVSLLNLTGRNFQIDSAKNVTVEGGSWGPASACGGPVGGNNNSIREPITGVAPENILINNTVIHDVQSYNLIECHIEGLAIFAGNHVTVSNSKFYGNSIYDVFIQANSGGSPNNVTLRGNWMADAVDNSGANGHEVGYHNGIVFGSEISANLSVIANHFNGVVNINDDGSISNYTGTSMQYNFGSMAYGGYPCGTALKGVLWTSNVWGNDKCGSGDVNVEGALPYLNHNNDGTLNYTLTGTYSSWPTEGGGEAAPANTALPALSGTATEGQVLTATNGTWSGNPTSFAYQWQDCNTAGSSCAAISGASASKYTLLSADVGHTVRAVVTATNAAGSTPASTAATATVAAAGGSGSGVLFVSSGGSDAGSCSQVAPCRSLARAYVVAKSGETVQVAEGSYTDSSLPLTSGKSAATPVVFEPAAGASVRFSKLVNVEARGVELKDFQFERELYFGETAESDVARDNALHNFEIIANGTKAPSNISIIGGTAGPVADSSDNENNLIATNGPETTAVPTKITIEGVLIHEYTKVGSAHVDCLQIWAGNELVIAGNTFRRCAVFDIFLQSLPNGSAGTPRNVTIQNNFLEKTIEGFYSIFLPRHNEGNQEHFENVVIRNNSATQGISADPRAKYTNVKFDGNIAPSVVFWNEATEVNEAEPAGVESDYNVFYGAGAKKIGAHDQTAAAGFVSESTMNLNLAAGAVAIKHGNPNDFPTTDINGNTRPNPPDAGAAQFTG
jgi:hypothetical protein